MAIDDLWLSETTIKSRFPYLSEYGVSSEWLSVMNDSEEDTYLGTLRFNAGSPALCANSDIPARELQCRFLDAASRVGVFSSPINVGFGIAVSNHDGISTRVLRVREFYGPENQPSPNGETLLKRIRDADSVFAPFVFQYVWATNRRFRNNSHESLTDPILHDELQLGFSNLPSGYRPPRQRDSPYVPSWRPGA